MVRGSTVQFDGSESGVRFASVRPSDRTDYRTGTLGPGPSHRRTGPSHPRPVAPSDRTS